MPNIDLILYILLGAFILYGFWFGLIHVIGGLVGVVLGSIFAGRIYEPIAQWLQPIFGGDPNFLRVISFIIAFVLINRLVGFAFWIVERIFKVISIIPFLKSINRLSGAVLGLVEGIFVLGGIVFIMARFPVISPWQTKMQQSGVAQYLARTYAVMEPLLPKALRDFDPTEYFKKIKLP